MESIIHKYHFDLREPAQRDAWEKLSASLSESHPHCMESLGQAFHYDAPFRDGDKLTLETTHLFDNQWNTAPGCGTDKGYRVFDWALDFAPHGNKHIKQGYWLEQTAAMREARANTLACGFCGNQVTRESAPAFCPLCIGSEYLKASELHLLRMRPIAIRFNLPRDPLTAEESARLLPIYREAQLHGNTERDKQRIARQRADIATKRDTAIGNAKAEAEGMLWLMDHGMKTDNVIFYTHTGRFGFGWRSPVDSETLSGLLDVISEFSFPYDIKCADGRTLSS